MQAITQNTCNDQRTCKQRQHASHMAAKHRSCTEQHQPPRLDLFVTSRWSCSSSAETARRNKRTVAQNTKPRKLTHSAHRAAQWLQTGTREHPRTHPAMARTSASKKNSKQRPRHSGRTSTQSASTQFTPQVPRTTTNSSITPGANLGSCTLGTQALCHMFVRYMSQSRVNHPDRRPVWEVALVFPLPSWCCLDGSVSVVLHIASHLKR
jgi:hypothetical protein